jgi:hypothetical protein
MTTTLAERIGQAATRARRQALSFPASISKDDLPWAVIDAFDTDIRGNVERDRRIEEERDRVLIASVKLAETPPDEEEEIAAARSHLVDAIDYLEQAVLRFGIVNRQGSKLGLT